MTLTDFLLQRIAEDEEEARDSICPCGGPACNIEIGWYRHGELCERLGDGNPVRQAAHVLRWSPKRVVAECEAKRRVVDLWRGAGREASMGAEWPVKQFFDGRLSVIEAAIRALATAYANHPDYRQEWRP